MQKQTSILLVDDHAMLRKGLRALIEQEPGLSVIEEAENGQEAIEKVRKLQPDVVVMDINMPRLNGIEATRQIFAENPDCRILALSIHSTRRYVEEMLEAGVAGYLLKESAPEELLAAIHALRDGKGYLSKDITELVIEKVRETAAAAAATNGSRSDSRKWRKPELTDGLIHRRDLVLRLENEHHKFLTLLVAPAGYGKSTLVCDWLNRHRHPHLWWSIGPEDNDLRRFCESWVAMTAEPLADRPRHLPALVDYEFTAQMEDDLDSISRGESQQLAYLHDFYFGLAEDDPQRLQIMRMGLHALVATGDGGYAVEVVDGGSTSFVAVEPGMFNDGMVEVDGITPGTDVVVAS